MLALLSLCFAAQMVVRSWTRCLVCKTFKALLTDNHENIWPCSTQRCCCCLYYAAQVVVFSWTGCPFCKNAKALLTDVGAQFTAVELDTLGQEGKAIRAELAVVRTVTTVFTSVWK